MVVDLVRPKYKIASFGHHKAESISFLVHGHGIGVSSHDIARHEDLESNFIRDEWLGVSVWKHESSKRRVDTYVASDST